MDFLANREKKIIAKQLGRPADNLGGIARYCPWGKPAVLLTLPYNREKGVFPTTYWLSCPYLQKEVAILEDTGLIQELTEKLQSDKELHIRLIKAHQDYAANRFSLLSEQDKTYLKEKSPAILEILRSSGVGGIRKKAGIKCLHTHLAHLLAGGDNPVGEIVWDLVSWPKECNLCQLEEIIDEIRGD